MHRLAKLVVPFMNELNLNELHASPGNLTRKTATCLPILYISTVSGLIVAHFSTGYTPVEWYKELVKRSLSTL